MSPNSVKILKNQSKQQKLKRLIKLNFVVLSMIISGGILIFYLLPDIPVSFNAADENENIQMQNDLPSIEITTFNSDSKDNLNQQDQKHSSIEASKIITLDIPQKTMQHMQTEKIMAKELSTPHTKLTTIDLSQKTPTLQKDVTEKIVKHIPSIKIKIEQKTENLVNFNQSLKIDSLDAIILLELDTPIPPSIN